MITMKLLKNLFYVLPMALLLFTSCDDEVSVDNFEQGEADFSTYVALGNSLTSGYADGSLYLSAQSNSYPALLAQQFQIVGGGDFSQPLVNDDLGGLTIGGTVFSNPKFILTTSGLQPAPGAPSTEVTASIAGSGPYNNLGVPGAKSSHLLYDGYGSLAGLATGSANPYYVRFSNPNESVLASAMAQNPSFFTLWIGNNDVLGFATSGGAEDYITSQADFNTYIAALLQGLTSTGAKGVIANIPNVTDIPYFNTVPSMPIPMDAALAGGVNAQYAAYNIGLEQFAAFGLISAEEAAMRMIQFNEGNNYPVIMDKELTPLMDQSGNPIPQIRQLKEGELLTLTSSSVIGSLANNADPTSVIGVAVPLGDEFVLTKSEMALVAEAIAGYNNTIQLLANNFDVPVADMNKFFNEIATSGLIWNGADFSVEFVSGGLFSLDGVHPTQKGYSLIANKFIEIINRNYSASVPSLDINDYPGVTLP